MSDYLSSVDAAWLAGLLEGEGCFSIHTPKNRRSATVQVKLAMTDQDVVERAYRLARVGVLGGPYSSRITGNRDRWVWSVSKREDVEALLLAIYPLMGERRRRKIEKCLMVARERPLIGRPKAS